MNKVFCIFLIKICNHFELLFYYHSVIELIALSNAGEMEHCVRLANGLLSTVNSKMNTNVFLTKLMIFFKKTIRCQGYKFTPDGYLAIIAAFANRGYANEAEIMIKYDVFRLFSSKKQFKFNSIQHLFFKKYSTDNWKNHWITNLTPASPIVLNNCARRRLPPHQSSTCARSPSSV